MTKTKKKFNKNIKFMMHPNILLNSCPGLNPSNPNGNIMVSGKVKTPYLKNPDAFFVGFISIFRSNCRSVRGPEQDGWTFLDCNSNVDVVVLFIIRVFHKLDEIGNNANIGIRGFTT